MTDKEMQKLLDKDNGLLRDKLERYGRMFFVENVLHKATRRQKLAFDALKKILILEAQGEQYHLHIRKSGFEIIKV